LQQPRYDGSSPVVRTLQCTRLQLSPYDGSGLWTLPGVKHATLIAGDGVTRTPARLAIIVRASAGLPGLDGSV